MGTKTLLYECFLNRGFTLLQWLLNLVLQIPHFILNIKGQCNITAKLVSQHDYWHCIISIYLCFQPTTFLIMPHRLYTKASLYSHGCTFCLVRNTWGRVMIWYDRWITESGHQDAVSDPAVTRSPGRDAPAFLRQSSDRALVPDCSSITQHFQFL